MKLLKKCLCSVLLGTVLLTSVPTAAYASEMILNQETVVNSAETGADIPETILNQETVVNSAETGADVPTMLAGKLVFKYYESGRVVVNLNQTTYHIIWDDNFNQTGLYYYPGESFYYDRVYSSPDGVHNFASYVNSSGVRRYVITSYYENGVKKYIPGLTIY
jgi:hypothetical protein